MCTCQQQSQCKVAVAFETGDVQTLPDSVCTSCSKCEGPMTAF